MPRLRNLASHLLRADGDVLTKPAIEKCLRRRDIVVEPLLHEVGACHVDVRLDNYFGTFRSTGEAALDPGVQSRAIRFEEVLFFSRPFYVQPGMFVLAQTLEFIALPTNIVATLDGRSSLGRRGLVVHATAAWIDPGWEGHITFELANLGVMPLALYPSMRIGRLVFRRIADTGKYTGQFQKQLRIKEPNVDLDCASISRHADAMRQRRAE